MQEPHRETELVRPSAQIIAFPGIVLTAPTEPEPVQAVAAPEHPTDRLRRALASLDVALAEQREAVTKWRGALAALNTGVRALSNSMTTLHGQVNKLGTHRQD